MHPGDGAERGAEDAVEWRVLADVEGEIEDDSSNGGRYVSPRAQCKASWTLTTTWFESTLLWHTLQSLKRRAGAQSPSGHLAPSPAGPSVESFSSGDAPPASKRADVKNSPTSRKTTAFSRTSASSGSQHPTPAFLEPQEPPVASCTTSGARGLRNPIFKLRLRPIPDPLLLPLAHTR